MPPSPSISDSVAIDIPTDNMFNALEVEDIPDEDLPPLPLQTPSPTPATKPSQKPSRSSVNKPSPPPESTTSSTCSPVDPGHKAPASAPSLPKRANRTVLIMGDSIPKHLSGRRLSQRLKVISRCIPGATIELWQKLAPVFISEHNPSCVILHLGTNNIPRTFPQECLDQFCELGLIIRKASPSINIVCSSLTIQNIRKAPGRNAWIKEYNARLLQKCIELKWTYIDNSNITKGHLASDGLHLEKNGTRQLAMNFSSFLRFMTTTILNT